jgi:hypothetical protein
MFLPGMYKTVKVTFTGDHLANRCQVHVELSGLSVQFFKSYPTFQTGFAPLPRVGNMPFYTCPQVILMHTYG